MARLSRVSGHFVFKWHQKYTATFCCSSSNTWEPAANIYAKDKIEEFENKFKASSKVVKSKRKPKTVVKTVVEEDPDFGIDAEIYGKLIFLLSCMLRGSFSGVILQEIIFRGILRDHFSGDNFQGPFSRGSFTGAFLGIIFQGIIFQRIIFRGNFPGDHFPGDNCPGDHFPRDHFPGGSVSRGSVSRG